MADFLDQLGTVFTDGLSKKIDQETRAPQPINDDRTFSTVPGAGGSIPNGFTLPAGLSGSNAALIGGGLLVSLVLLKVLKVI